MYFISNWTESSRANDKSSDHVKPIEKNLAAIIDKVIVRWYTYKPQVDMFFRISCAWIPLPSQVVIKPDNIQILSILSPSQPQLPMHFPFSRDILLDTVGSIMFREKPCLTSSWESENKNSIQRSYFSNESLLLFLFIG